MMGSDGKRIPEISIINVVLCMLVVFIHVTSAPVSSLNRAGVQYAVVYLPWRLASFCMQGFVFLTALRTYLNKTGKFDCLPFYRSRFIKILLPYLAFNVIYYIYFAAIGYFRFSAAALLLYMLNGTLVSPFYFIVVIVQFYLLAPLCHKLIKAVNPFTVLVIAAVFTFLFKEYLPSLIRLISGYEFIFNDRIFTTYLFYWLAGAYAGMNYERFKNFVKNRRTFLISVFAVLGVMNAAVSYLAVTGAGYFRHLELIHYAYCAAAVFGLYALIQTSYKKSELENRLIRETDAAGFYIFLIHCLVINLANHAMRYIGIDGIGVQYIIRIAVVYTGSISAGILWIRFRRLSLICIK